jgi:hypothetical protein
MTADSLLAADIKGSRNDSGRGLAAQPYVSGEAFPYKFDVTNTSPLTEKVVPTAGNFSPFIPEGPGNCRYTALPAGQSYTCSTPATVSPPKKPNRDSSSPAAPGKSVPPGRLPGPTLWTAGK